MNSKFIILWGCCLICTVHVLAQKEDNFEEALEQYVTQTGKEIKDDSRLLVLRSYLDHPLNLNTASKEDLKQLFFLNDLQIHAFLKYRKLLGEVIDLYELQAVPYWDVATIQRLLPYISVSKSMLNTQFSLKELFKKAEVHLLLRYKRTLEKKKGYLPMDSSGHTHFLGSPGAVYFRMQYKMARNMNMGITAERDAGEAFSGYGQKGFDFYSFHFYLENQGIIKALALGDYRINLGQGLINQQGLSFGKTGMVMNIDRSQKTISPHSSAMEFGFYRGAAVKIGKKHWSTTWFVSKKPEDAHLYHIDSTHRYFRSFQQSGYHRSVSDLKNKRTIKHLSTGGNMQYDFDAGHIGVNVVYHHFSDSMGKSTQPYQLFHSTGRHMLNASVDYSWYLDRLYLFGETAMNKKGAWATVNGLLMSVDRHVDISLLYRNFSTRYNALYAHAFEEGSHPQNEVGFYLGAAIRPALHWEIKTYFDLFKSKWLRYRVDEPSFGKENFLQVNYTPSKQFRTYLRFRYQRKPINMLSEIPMAKVVNRSKYNLRLFMQWKWSEYFSIRDQVEGVYFKKGHQKAEKGWMFYQNVRWETNQNLSGNFRIGYFNTDSYNARLYTFENNVRYAFYVPSFYGEGMRAYINIRFNLGNRISLWSRIARTWYFNRETISSGWNEIQGNKRTKFTLEFIYE